MNIFDRAYAYAKKIHANDFRKDGVTPYMVHIDAVVAGTDQRVRNLYPNVNEFEIGLIKSVAALHDAMEDHPETVTRETILDNLGREGVADDVLVGIIAITKKPKGEESYDNYVRRVASHEWARIVKLADLEHNMSDLKPGSMRDKYELTKWVLENVKIFV